MSEYAFQSSCLEKHFKLKSTHVHVFPASPLVRTNHLSRLTGLPDSVLPVNKMDREMSRCLLYLFIEDSKKQLPRSYCLSDMYINQSVNFSMNSDQQ